MFLSDVDIKKALEKGEIIIEPFNEKQLQSASYDVCLGNEFTFYRQYKTRANDPCAGVIPPTKTKIIPDGEEFVLHPGAAVLAKQKEFIGTDLKHLILLSGKSSLARLGLAVHTTAFLFNPGHKFYPTFELLNTHPVPIVLRPGMEIAQIIFARLSSEASQKYAGKDGTGRYDAENSSHFAPKREK